MSEIDVVGFSDNSPVVTAQPQNRRSDDKLRLMVWGETPSTCWRRSRLTNCETVNGRCRFSCHQSPKLHRSLRNARSVAGDRSRFSCAVRKRSIEMSDMSLLPGTRYRYQHRTENSPSCQHLIGNVRVNWDSGGAVMLAYRYRT